MAQTFPGGLGFHFNVGGVNVPVDAAAGNGETGLRVSMKDALFCTFLVIQNTDAGTTDDIAVDLQEHTAASGGTTQDLDIVTNYWMQSETALDGDETWSKTTQTAASEITAIAGTAELEFIMAIGVHKDQLSAGYTHVSLNIANLGSTDTQFVTIVPILTGLAVQRTPENIAVTQ